MKRYFWTLLAVVMVTFSLASAAFGVTGPRIVISGHPDFIMPPSLGFYVAVGTPYDLYRVNNNYYVFHNNAWYRGAYYNGPWRAVNYRQLPPGLRHHNHDQIRAIRDEEYRHYRDNRDGYRGKHFKPDKAWKDQRKADKKQAKQEEKHWKEERKADKKQAKHEQKEWKDDRHGDRRGGK
jgi:hypothetical protein